MEELLTKKAIILDMITVDEFVTTRDINELAGRITSGNVTSSNVYQVFKKHQKERVDFFTEELQNTLFITRKENGEDITFDAGNYIEQAFEEGKSITHCSKYLKLPMKSIENFLEYSGYQTSANTKGEVKELIDKLKIERKKSRELYFDFVNGEYNKIVNKEKTIKKKIVELLESTSNRKKQRQDGVVITAKKEYNKKSFTTQQIIDRLGEDKAKELFDIEPTQEWKYNIITTQFDNKIKGDK